MDEERNILQPHGPKGEGVDPLTTGEKTFGEDIKGNSIDKDLYAPAEVEETDVLEGVEEAHKKKGFLRRFK